MNTGPLTECRVDVGGATLVAHLPQRANIAEGERVVVSVPAEDVVLLPADATDAQ